MLIIELGLTRYIEYKKVAILVDIRARALVILLGD